MSLMRCGRVLPTGRLLLSAARQPTGRRSFADDKLDDEKTGFATHGIPVPQSTANQPVLHRRDTKRKELDEYLGEVREKQPIETMTSTDEVAEISGVPVEHREERRARIFRPARNAEQSPWNNTRMWKIDLDMQERWDNPLIGWASTADPMSNISMNLDFATAEDAIAFCKKAQWPYVVETPQERQIKPKAYGNNFHWNKRFRVGTK